MPQKMFKSLAIVGAFLVLSVSASVRADDRASEAEIAGLFATWNAALQTGNPATVAALYAENGVLLPTVSNKPRDTKEEIEDYFHHFLELKPKGHINEQYIRVLDDDTALNAGIYTFDVVRHGKPAHVQARYSFLYEKIDGKWMIMHHHSSAMPEPVH